MSTYDPKQVLADYANGRITPEMAVGHSLQHIGKLYEALKTTNAGQTKADALEKRIDALQTAVDRLTAFMAQFMHRQKPNLPSQRKPDQA